MKAPDCPRSTHLSSVSHEWESSSLVVRLDHNSLKKKKKQHLHSQQSNRWVIPTIWWQSPPWLQSWQKCPMLYKKKTSFNSQKIYWIIWSLHNNLYCCTYLKCQTICLHIILDLFIYLTVFNSFLFSKVKYVQKFVLIKNTF